MAPLYATVQADKATYTADLAQLQADKMSFITARKLVLADLKTLNADLLGNL